MSWHVDPDTLDRYGAALLDPVSAWSVEAHLLACDRCRATVAAVVDGSRLDAVWAGIVEEIDAPAPGPIERLLLRLGVEDSTARLLAATPSLQASWLAAVALALTFAVVAAQQGHRGLLLFLSLAPLLPLAGVAAAYGPAVDPTHELTVAAPTSTFWLLLVRSVSVITATSALVGVAALALPGLHLTAAAWLLPALGLSLTALALSSVLNPVVAACGCGVTWLGVVTISEQLAALRFAAFGPQAQVAFFVVAVAAGTALVVQRQQFELQRG